MSAQPTGPVTVTAGNTAGDPDITVTGGATLSFTTSNWGTYQMVTLSAAEDNGDNVNGTATISCDADDAGVTDATVAATEDDDDHTLTITAQNGSVARNPNTPYYDHGSTVELTATANNGYQFAGWSGDTTGDENPVTVTMDGDKAVTANFMPMTDPINDLMARAKDRKIDIVWTPVPTAVSYNIYRGTDPNEPLALIKEGHVSNYAVYADIGLQNGVTYYYVVRYIDKFGRESEDSNMASATPKSGRTRRRR